MRLETETADWGLDLLHSGSAGPAATGKLDVQTILPGLQTLVPISVLCISSEWHDASVMLRSIVGSVPRGFWLAADPRRNKWRLVRFV